MTNDQTITLLVVVLLFIGFVAFVRWMTKDDNED